MIFLFFFFSVSPLFAHNVSTAETACFDVIDGLASMLEPSDPQTPLSAFMMDYEHLASMLLSTPGVSLRKSLVTFKTNVFSAARKLPDEQIASYLNDWIKKQNETTGYVVGLSPEVPINSLDDFISDILNFDLTTTQRGLSLRRKQPYLRDVWANMFNAVNGYSDMLMDVTYKKTPEDRVKLLSYLLFRYQSYIVLEIFRVRFGSGVWGVFRDERERKLYRRSKLEKEAVRDWGGKK